VTTQESWVVSKWRPTMGWVYVIIVVFDFLVAPILWTVAQGYFAIGAELTLESNISKQWQPITLLGGGLFHVAMGGVLGITAWGRTQEKLNGVAGNPRQLRTTEEEWTPEDDEMGTPKKELQPKDEH